MIRHSGRAQRDPESRGRKLVVCPWVPGLRRAGAASAAQAGSAFGRPGMTKT
jgi:hypothetical protein